MNEVLGHNEQEFLTSTSEQNGGRHDTGHISNRTDLAKAPGRKQERARSLTVFLDMFPCDLSKSDTMSVARLCESPYLAGSIVILRLLLWVERFAQPLRNTRPRF